MQRLLPLVMLLTACEAFDGGIVPITNLGPRPDATGDTTGLPSVSIVSPVASAAVDGDWVVLEIDVANFPLDADRTLVITATGGSFTPVVVATPDADGRYSVPISRLPVGTVTIRAALASSTVVVTFSEVSVEVTRTTPTLAITAPVADSILPLAAPTIAVELAVTDFDLLATGEAQTGPRQGRIAVQVDGGAPTIVADSSTMIPTPAAGEHTLKAYLVEGDGAPYGGADTTVTVPFAVSPTTSVSIVSPTAGQTVEGARITIGLAPVGFVTDGAEQAGHGTFEVTLDGAVLATRRTGTSITLGGVAAGEHTVQVQLTTAAGAPLDPAASASVTFTSVLLPPEVELVLPASAKVKEGAVRVAILPRHFSFSALPIPGPLAAATGGWQLYVDDVLAADRLTSAQTTVVLTAGTHVLEARLIDAAGNTLAPEVSAQKSVEVVPIETAVGILSPATGATVPQTFTVAVAFEDFTLSDQVIAPNDPIVPGVGHFHAFLRKQGEPEFVYQGFFLTEAFQLTATPGIYDLKVALHYQNHTPVVPGVEATVSITVDDRPGIRIQTPLDGQTVGLDPFAVAVAVENFEIIPIGEVSTVRGHYHLFIDSAYQGFYLEPVAILDPLLTTPPLIPGSHRLEAVLHDSQHNPIPNARPDGIDFVYDPDPRVRILQPTPGTALTGEPFELVVEVEHFKIVDKAGQAPVAGEGHIHVFVDGAYLDFYTSDRATLTLDEPGPHTIEVTLNENDHDPVEGAVSAAVQVTVDTAPRIHIVAPGEGSFTYGGDVAFMVEPLNIAADSDTEMRLELDGILFYEGDPFAFDIPPLGEGVHTLRTTPIGPTGDPVVGGKSETISFEVIAAAPPTITWVSPAPNATLIAGSTVTVGVTDFTLEPVLARRPAVPGDGLWTLSVGARTYGPFAGPTAVLPALPRGPTTLVAELWHRDESRVMPVARASLQVTIGGTSPAVSFVSPSPTDVLGETFYGDTVPVIVDVSDFALAPGAGWLSVKLDGEQAALVQRHEVHLPITRTGLHTLEVELVDAAAHAPLSPPVRATTTFRAGGLTKPTLNISAPPQGADIDGDEVTISFALANLSLAIGADGGLGGRRQPGHGAVLVYVDGRVEAIATASPVTVKGLAPGAHRIELVAAGLDLVPLAPRISDAVDVDLFDD